MTKTEIPQYSREGFLKAMGMFSGYDIFIVCEGKDYDTEFYKKLYEKLFPDKKVLVRQIRILVGTGGKPAVMGLHKELVRSNEILDNGRLRSLNKPIIFHVDKDIDDLNGDFIYHQNLIYTKYYCVENHILKESLFLEIIRQIFNHDPNIDDMGSDSGVYKNYIYKFRHHIALCVITNIFKIQGCSNYRAVPCQSLAEKQYQAIVKLCQEQPNLEEVIFNTWDHLLEMCERRFDEMFKGKWYGDLLNEIMPDEVGEPGYRNVSEALFAKATASMSINESCPHFKRQLSWI